MLKKRFLQLAVLILMLTGVISCSDITSEFDESLLIGKWERPSPFSDEENFGYEYYRYDIGGIGASWDTTDDVTEAEAQEFKWTLIKSDLTLTHKIETTDQYGIPKVYTVIKLTTTELVYKDDFGITYEFTKVEE
ncbi:MAG: lipocalin family protein [Paludibacteraceae bacterium]|nr:lipocalin family protein [Paludibacteraceae bacterium]